MIVSLSEGLRLLNSGGVTAFPTETFFGLAADPFNCGAVSTVCDLKDRAVEAGIGLIVDTSETFFQAVEWESEEQDHQVRALIQNYWPGPLTLIVDVKQDFRSRLAKEIPGPGGGIAFRCSSCRTSREVAAGLGGYVTATSANPKGLPAVKTSEAVEEYFSEIAIIQAKEGDGAFLEEQGSTFLDVRSVPFKVIRQGPIQVAI